MKLRDNEIPELSMFKLYRQDEHLHMFQNKNITEFICEQKAGDQEEKKEESKESL